MSTWGGESLVVVACRCRRYYTQQRRKETCIMKHFKDVMVVRRTSKRVAQDEENHRYSIEIEDVREFDLACSYDFLNEETCEAVVDNVAKMMIAQQEVIDGMERDYEDLTIEATRLQKDYERALKINRHLVEQLEEARSISKGDPKEIKQLFRIPNNKKGNEVVAYLRKHIQPGKYIVLRGRDAKPGKRGPVSTPLKDSQTLGVYVYNKKDNKGEIPFC
jgi:hypothetical protein